MAPSRAEDVSSLLDRHLSTVQLLKQKVEASFPDLKSSSILRDGTNADILFYLRYVLSSKDDLSSLERISDSNTFQAISYAITKRNESFAQVSKEQEAEVLKLIPMIRTGTLHNGFPVLFLPVKAALDQIGKITGDKKCQELVQSVLLSLRNELYKELDKETREKGKLIKSVTIYDLAGLSFSHVYKIKDFMKVINGQKKLFKKLFPQSTEVTVFVNFSQTFWLKKCFTSSKQLCMKSEELIKKLDCAHVLPPSMGGTFSSLDTKQNPERTVLVASLPPPEPMRIERRGVEEMIEREMVKMSKGKLFSVNVLAENQKVELFFNNMRNKKANILIVTKEKQDPVKRFILPEGFSSLPLQLKQKGEILIVQLDRALAKRMEKRKQGKLNLERQRLRGSTTRRAVRYGRKKLTKKKKDIPFSQLDFMRLQQVSGTIKPKVYFRFEVTENVVFGEQTKLTEVDMKGYENLGENVHTEEVESKEFIDFEGESLCSRDSIHPDTEASFFSTAVRILGQGIIW